jgi:hypothetical protein
LEFIWDLKFGIWNFYLLMGFVIWNLIYMSKKIILIYACLLLISLAVAHSTLATDTINFTPEISIPGSNFLAGQTTAVGASTSLICDYIIAIYKYAIAIIGIFAVVAIAFGGAIWILSAGNSSRITEGKSWVTGGLLGLALALGSFIILATINSQLVTCQIDTLQSLQNQVLPQATPVYTSDSLKAGTVTAVLDSSGQYKCCVIQGKPYDPDFGLSGQYCSGNGDGSKECPTAPMEGVKRCATYESANTGAAQTACDKFYSGYNCYDPLLKYNCYFEIRPRQGTSGGLWSATIYDGKCWENTNTKDWCKGQ